MMVEVGLLLGRRGVRSGGARFYPAVVKALVSCRYQFFFRLLVRLLVLRRFLFSGFKSSSGGCLGLICLASWFLAGISVGPHVFFSTRCVESM